MITMKQLLLLAFTAMMLAACKKEATPTVPGMDTVDSSAMINQTGAFINGPYGNVRGTAKIITASDSASFSLVLQDMSISNGPDLHVYLSKEIQPVNFIDLGKLKSTSGTQVYSIIGTPDFSQYRYALIHCQQFNHLFGSAELK